MIQYWTTNKPEKAGWWWAMYDNIAKIVRIIEYDYYENGTTELYCIGSGDEELYSLKNITSDVLWSSSPISEPSTRKY